MGHLPTIQFRWNPEKKEEKTTKKHQQQQKQAFLCMNETGYTKPKTNEKPVSATDAPLAASAGSLRCGDGVGFALCNIPGSVKTLVAGTTLQKVETFLGVEWKTPLFQKVKV